MKELTDKLDHCYINNGNARYIDYKRAEKILKQFKNESCIDFMYWLIEEKYCLDNPVDDIVDEFLKTN